MTDETIPLRVVEAVDTSQLDGLTELRSERLHPFDTGLAALVR